MSIPSSDEVMQLATWQKLPVVVENYPENIVKVYALQHILDLILRKHMLALAEYDRKGRWYGTLPLLWYIWILSLPLFSSNLIW